MPEIRASYETDETDGAPPAPPERRPIPYETLRTWRMRRGYTDPDTTRRHCDSCRTSALQSELHMAPNGLSASWVCDSCARCAHRGCETPLRPLASFGSRVPAVWNERAGRMLGYCAEHSEHLVWGQWQSETILSEGAIWYVPPGYDEADGGWCSSDYAEEYLTQRPDGRWVPRPSYETLEYRANVLAYCEHDKKALAAGALMFGVELEMEPTGEDNLVEVLGGNTSQRFILKSDGSLDEGGVELVTVPLTLEQHRTEFGWERTLAPLLPVAKSGRRTTHCGMHVHINKRALTPLTIGKMLVLTNSAANAPLMTDIAQRASTGYCSRDTRKKVTDGNKSGYNRYDMVNLTNSRTVEIRIFRGNLRWERVIKNLEFCHALVTYCKDASIRAVETPKDFLGWLVRHRAEYPYLTEFLASHGYFESAKKMPRVAEA